jgi:hypothetical protein
VGEPGASEVFGDLGALVAVVAEHGERAAES